MIDFLDMLKTMKEIDEMMMIHDLRWWFIGFVFWKEKNFWKNVVMDWGRRRWKM